MRDSSSRHDPEPLRPEACEFRRKRAALRSGLQKRAAGVPTYSVPEAAALLSVSREHLYRLIRVGAFPALRMGLGAEHGRYVVSARTVEDLLDTVPAAAVREPDTASAAAAGGAR